MSILNVDKIQPIGGGSTITVDATDIQATSATITASSFVGGLPITSGADNRVITASSASAIQGESNLTFDGNTLALDSNTGTINVSRNSRTLTLEGNYGNEGHPAIKTSSGHDLRIFTNGNNEKLRITSAGDVGIGTANPQSRKLHVLGTTRPVEIGSTNATNIVKLYNSATGRATYNGVDILASSTDGGKFNVYGGSIMFGTSASNGSDVTERFRITGAGKVGIGTNDPKQSLSITGRVSIDAKNDYYGVWADGDTAGENHISVGRWYNTGGGLKSGYTAYGINNLILENNHATAAHSLIIQPKGQKVAIGTHITDGLVHIGQLTAGSVSADADADELVLESGGNTGMSILSPGSGESSIYFGNPGTNGQKDAWIKYYHETHSTTGNRRHLVFATGGNTERVRISNGGNLGIARTNPQYRIHLHTAATNNTQVVGLAIANDGSNTGVGGKINMGAANGYDSTSAAISGWYDGTGTALSLFTTASYASTGHVERLRITSSGRFQYYASGGQFASFRETFRSGDISNGGTFTAQTWNCHACGTVTVTANLQGSSNNKRCVQFPISLNSTSNANLGSSIFTIDGSTGQNFSVAGTSRGVTVTNSSGNTVFITVTFDITGSC